MELELYEILERFENLKGKSLRRVAFLQANSMD